MRHPGPGTRCPVIHPGTGGVAGGVSAVDAALDVLLSPVGHLTMHHQHPFTRPPPGGSSRGRTVRRVPRVRYVTVSNCLVVLTNTERKTRYQERRKAGGSRFRRPANRRVRSTPRHAACSGSRRSALALVWVERHDRPRPLAGGHRLPGVSRARDAMRFTRRQAHHLVATVDVRLQPAPVPRAIPESGGLPPPVIVMDGRDAPSRPGRKAHNCNLSGGTDGVSPARAVA